MQFVVENCAKVPFKKGLQVKSKKINLNVNTGISESKHNKTFKYLKIDEANGLPHSMNKKKISEEFYRRIKASLKL